MDDALCSWRSTYGARVFSKKEKKHAHTDRDCEHRRRRRRGARSAARVRADTTFGRAAAGRASRGTCAGLSCGPRPVRARLPSSARPSENPCHSPAGSCIPALPSCRRRGRPPRARSRRTRRIHLPPPPAPVASTGPAIGLVLETALAMAAAFWSGGLPLTGTGTVAGPLPAPGPAQWPTVWSRATDPPAAVFAAMAGVLETGNSPTGG